MRGVSHKDKKHASPCWEGLFTRDKCVWHVPGMSQNANLFESEPQALEKVTSPAERDDEAIGDKFRTEFPAFSHVFWGV